MTALPDLDGHPLFEKKIAGHRGVRVELKAARDRGYTAAAGFLAEHDQPEGVELTKSAGNIDYYVNLDDTDTGPGEPGAAAIEADLHILRRALGRI